MMPPEVRMGCVETAACLAVGSELLGQERVDTNSLTVTRFLAGFGVRMTEKRVVGDDVKTIAQAVAGLLKQADIVVVTGGLGPTADDVTREGVAAALGREVQRDADIEVWIRERYAKFRREMPASCVRMADVIPGARVLRNSRGTAPGLLFEIEDRLLAVLPGVPWEMELMLEHDLKPVLEKRNADRRRSTRTLLLSGVIESEVEERIRHLYDRFGRENVTILASAGLVRLLLSNSGPAGEIAPALDRMEAAFREVLGRDVAAVGSGDIAEVVLEMLREQGAMLATAESCTGGLVGKLLTDIPGSSDVYTGGVVSYSNAAKGALLGVPDELLAAHGAVSEPVALAMAKGVRQRLSADWGLAITGIAGPAGGTTDKPVGLVYWAVAGPEGDRCLSRVLPGSRSLIRRLSANIALDLLRRGLIRGGA